MMEKKTDKKSNKSIEIVFAGREKNNKQSDGMRGRCTGCGGTVLFGIKLIA